MKTIPCPKCGAKNPDYETSAHMCRKCGWTWTKDFGVDHLNLAVHMASRGKVPVKVERRKNR